MLTQTENSQKLKRHNSKKIFYWNTDKNNIGVE